MNSEHRSHRAVRVPRGAVDPLSLWDAPQRTGITVGRALFATTVIAGTVAGFAGYLPF